VPEEDRPEKGQVDSKFGTMPRPKVEVSEEKDREPPRPLRRYGCTR
jgi:hypothetical protein